MVIFIPSRAAFTLQGDRGKLSGVRKVTSQPRSAPRDLTCRVLRSEEPTLVLLAFTPSADDEAKRTLTRAEEDIAMCIARGLSNAQIARSRGVSVRTVANQVASILKKLDASSRVQVAAKFQIADLA